MTDRRQFLQALSAVPCLMLGRGAAAAEGAYKALVIGNAAYAHGPLPNPGNDAVAMAGMLGRAGFAVDLLRDAGQTAMHEAIERFGRQVGGRNTRLAVFYYAGHGAQLDWRNYLRPVDAAVDSAETLKSRCVDLGMLLGHFTRAQRHGEEKNFVVILDACRDNPFGAAYQPREKGLSQFDAPVGSLIAYATAPGRVAFDGEGGNGLYTDHLLREIARPGVRIEDALKRVRLNVRLASQGRQIPWESTSLENDIYLSSPPARKLSEEELERQFNDELTHWNRIKASQRSEDWIEYLRLYPNGRFSEIAQARLNRLLAEVERRQAPVPAPQALAPAPTAAARDKSPADAETEVAVPRETQAAVSANPYSAGRYPLGRKFTVGDRVVLRERDLLTGIEGERRRLRVTRVDEVADRVELNDGKWLLDTMGNQLETPMYVSDIPQQFFPAELQVGKRWALRYSLRFKAGRLAGQTSSAEMEARIQARETVAVPAGEFTAFRIEARGWSSGGHLPVEISLTFWVVPGLNFPVRTERIKRLGTRLLETQLVELLAIRQAVSGLPD